MAKSTTGKWVSRVGASGGGKAYKKSRPSNYYGALAVIVILGIAATVLARYDYVHPHHAPRDPAGDRDHLVRGAAHRGLRRDVWPT